MLVKRLIYLKMKLKITQIFNLVFFILITNNNFLLAHDSFNGGCNNHCEKSFDLNTLKKNKKIKKSNYIKDQIEDNFSCLSKSLCRG